MTAVTKNARLDLRMTATQRELIERAADVAGTTVTSFAVTRLVADAEQVVRQAKTIQLDDDEWDAFVQILDAPPAPKFADLLSRTPAWDQL
jgi:uncharacterized protein (DUF1778 family)